MSSPKTPAVHAPDRRAAAADRPPVACRLSPVKPKRAYLQDVREEPSWASFEPGESSPPGTPSEADSQDDDGAASERSAFSGGGRNLLTSPLSSVHGGFAPHRWGASQPAGLPGRLAACALAVHPSGWPGQCQLASQQGVSQVVQPASQGLHPALRTLAPLQTKATAAAPVSEGKPAGLLPT